MAIPGPPSSPLGGNYLLPEADIASKTHSRNSSTSSAGSGSTDVFVNGPWHANDPSPDVVISASTSRRRGSSPTEGLTFRSGGSRESFSEAARSTVFVQQDDNGSAIHSSLSPSALGFRSASFDAPMSSFEPHEQAHWVNIGGSSDALHAPVVDESDTAILTSNQTEAGYDRLGRSRSHGRGNHNHVEAGNYAADSPVHRRQSRRTSRDWDATAPGLQRARSGISRVSRSIRRASIRVVNIRGEESTSELPLSAGQDEVVVADAYDGQDEGDDYRLREARALAGLRGKSLGVFGPDSKLRKALAKVLVNSWTEPIILALIIADVVVLTIQSAKSVFNQPRKPGYFNYWEDYALFVLFIFFTIEIVARIIVGGLFVNPGQEHLAPAGLEDPDSPTEVQSDHLNFSSKLKAKAAAVLRPSPSLSEKVSDFSPKSASRLRSFAGKSRHNGAPPRLTINTSTTDLLDHPTPDQNVTKTATVRTTGTFFSLNEAPFKEAISRQRSQATQSAFLRHSWNRLDLIAVVSFWIMFILAILRLESTPNAHIYIFRALSVLRSTRLLTITSGTATILKSLKRAGPMLVNVAFFVVFSMALFSIIGVQSFQGSYRRCCMWIDPAGVNNYTFSQLCGGHVNNVTGDLEGYLSQDGTVLSDTAKGFICPAGQLCVEQNNPQSGTQSFDNIFAALMQVVILVSVNTWSVVMYNMMDADYFVSCLYFIFGVLILNLWMMNLFVAVINNTFANILDETKQSAFAAVKVETVVAEMGGMEEEPRKSRQSIFKKWFDRTHYLWIIAIVADIGTQAAKYSTMSPGYGYALDQAELYFTIAFDIEIMLRFFTYLPDYRAFFRNKRNYTDLFLAIVTIILQIPAIHNTEVYNWLTIFQIARFYRVILAIPRMQRLLTRTLGRITGLLNMILFVLMMVFIASLIAVQLLRGDISASSGSNNVEINFKQIYNSFLGMYQLFSSENWTEVLYAALIAELPFKQAIITGIFLCVWILFGYFIMLQMFIGVINENLMLAEETKRKKQLEEFERKAHPPSASKSWIFKYNIYNYLKPKRSDGERTIPAPLSRRPTLSRKASVMRHYQEISEDDRWAKRNSLHDVTAPTLYDSVGRYVSNLWHVRHGSESIPLHEMRGPNDPNDVSGDIGAIEQELDRMRPENWGAERSEDEVNERRAEQAKFIAAHPSYDTSLFIFRQGNPIRKFCQRFVPPSYGERIYGEAPSPLLHALFQVSIFLAIAGSVTVAAIATPLYRRDYYQRYGLIRGSWFSVTEISLGLFFVLEFLVKVIADGLIFTPNAYLLSIWNGLDLFVLVTLLINVSSELVVIGGMSSFTRGLKAFRALRLINLSSRMRETFHAVMIAGFGRLFDASTLAVLYIIPYAVWGLNIFSGLLYSCNDGSNSIQTKYDCINEFSSQPLQWNFLAPRSWANPTQGTVYSFDDFKASLLVLFEIISLEGWINVMTTAMSIVGLDQQLTPDASQINAIFFVFYNLVGASVILALFVSLIIENFQTRSGLAFLTTEQRQWIDLRKLIIRQRPPKRPKVRPGTPFRAWCYDRAVQKHGWWSRSMTVLYFIHIIVLMTQRFGDPAWANTLRDYVFLGFTLVYLVDIIVRMIGLEWRNFRQNGWNIYDIIVVTGTLVTTIPILTGGENFVSTQLQKLFLVSIAFKLVQKNNGLNQLFKTAVASLPSIISLFILWFTMFLVWGLFMVEIFGLTKWGSNETHNINFSSFPRALVFLVMMTTGEGWNGFMHDYTLSGDLCTHSSSYLDSDCGSQGWAYVLFITWNVISMYIFVNMFTGTVVENFSYVYNLGGKPALSREQMRQFKKVWVEFDKERNGYIHHQHFVPFFAKLTGVFDVKVYPTEFSVPNLLKAASITATGPSSPMPSPSHSPIGSVTSKSIIVDGVDVRRLRRAVAKIDSARIARRKETYIRLLHEALISEEPGRGISFTNMLFLLVHYKLIDDERALQLGELHRRRQKLARVEELVNLDRLRGFLRTMVLRRRFEQLRRERHSKVPQILIDAQEGGEGERLLHSPTPSITSSLTLEGRGKLSLTLTPPSVEAFVDRDGYFDDLSRGRPRSPGGHLMKTDEDVFTIHPLFNRVFPPYSIVHPLSAASPPLPLHVPPLRNIKPGTVSLDGWTETVWIVAVAPATRAGETEDGQSLSALITQMALVMITFCDRNFFQT